MHDGCHCKAVLPRRVTNGYHLNKPQEETRSFDRGSKLRQALQADPRTVEKGASRGDGRQHRDETKAWQNS